MNVYGNTTDGYPGTIQRGLIRKLIPYCENSSTTMDLTTFSVCKDGFIGDNCIAPVTTDTTTQTIIIATTGSSSIYGF